MSALSEAGIDIVQLLTFQEKSGPDRLRARRLLRRISQGSSLADAMKAETYSNLEISLTKVAEESGAMSRVFKELASYFNDRYLIERTLKYALMKPTLLFFVSITCAALAPFFLGRIGLFGFLLRTAVPMLMTLIAYFYFFKLMWRSQRENFEFNTTLGAAMARERFFVAFVICVKAGSTKTASILREVCAHPSLKSATWAMERIAPEKGFGEAMKAAGVFTNDQVNGVRVGEFSGRLEQQLEAIVRDLRGEVVIQYEKFAEWAPRVLYSAMAVLVTLNLFF